MLELVGARHRETNEVGETAEAFDPGKVDVDILVRFAMSVFWRAHAVRHELCRNASLGTKYGEEVRRFLLGEGEFPKNARLLTYLFEDATVLGASMDLAMCLPVGARSGKHHFHRFILCGLYFHLLLGNDLPPRGLCLHHAEQKLLVLAPASQSGIVVDLLGMMEREIQRG
ncbi:MAG: hypothetical protein KC731_34685 [Myxococcales bacterium]|nr:hypothetical protein [Myxococcales bacterium]